MRSCRLRLCATAVVFVSVTLLIGGCGLKPQTTGDRIAQVSVPKTRPPNSIVIFKFRPHGDSDAKFYGAGFTTALGERMYCPHTSLILEGSSYEAMNGLGDQRRKRAQQWSREAVLRRGKTAGVRYILTGDAQLIGDRISLSAELSDVTTGSKRADFRTAGKLSDLPSMQASMAGQVIRAMGLKPDAEQSKALRTPTFSAPQTILLCGKSYFADDDQAREFAWQALRGDPDSLLAAEHVLACYQSRRDGYLDMRKDKRLSALVESVGRRFPTDPNTNAMIATLYADQYQFKKAEMLLRSAVKADPGSDYAHSMLVYVAQWRMDADLAVREGRLRVEAWPTNSLTHDDLAEAYQLAAHNARRGHPIRELTRARRRMWQANSESAFNEAAVAVRLDPDDARAWSIVMTTSLDLKWRDYADRAFREMVRIDPKDPTPYRYYAYGVAQDASGSKRLGEVLALADKNLGTGSADACLVRGWTLLAGSPKAQQFEEALSLANKALTKSGRSERSRSSALDLKAQALNGLDRMQEALETAEKGFGIDPSPRWRLLLADARLHAESQSRDPAALRETVELLTVYTGEIPFDSYGHMYLGCCLSRLGFQDLAVKEFAWAVALDPSDRYSRDALARKRPGLFE